MSAAIRLKRKARGERPTFFADPNVDKAIAMVMGLAGEVAVMRDRLDTVERLLDRTGALQRAEIEAFIPDTGIVAERAAWREAFLGEVLRIVEIEVEALANGDLERYDSAMRLVEEPPVTRAKPRKPPAAKKKVARKQAVAKKTAKKVARKAPARATKKAPARAARTPATRSAKKPPAARRPGKASPKRRARR